MTYLVFDNDPNRDYLVEVKERDEAGAIDFAWVINGGWDMILRNGEVLACSTRLGDDEGIVTRVPYSTFAEYDVPDEDEMGFGYNDIMYNMRKRIKEGTLYESSSVPDNRNRCCDHVCTGT